ncbi:MAG: acetylxylan esterase [Bryobacteraceae bacterium]|nr:alpha/beta hydrolase family protein [Bryobacterales bacterium]MEB2362757.1 acetylxylan esterase [Bryobacterales bacterium]NUN02014.1 acetylxylan esterase [Bryobacteraceae bacterium]
MFSVLRSLSRRRWLTGAHSFLAGGAVAQAQSGSPATRPHCYSAYDREWTWPVPLDAERRRELPAYSTRQYFLDQAASVRPALRFQPGRHDIGGWQRELRAELSKRLALDMQTKSPLSARVLSVEKFPGCRVEKIVYQSEPGVSVPSLLYLPDKLRAPERTLIHCHGHGSGPDHPLYSYKLEFVKRGYVVFAPEVRDFGQRAFGKPGGMACDRTYKLAALLGKNIAGLRLWDFLRAIDYLETRPEVDRRRIACGGLSLGGELAMLLAALDERIRASFISGFLSTYDALMFQKNNCICYTIPGIMALCRMSDIAGLIAPRPVVIQTGTRDNPVPTAGAQQAFRELQEIYRAARAADNAVIDIFEGVHEFHGDVTFAEFDRWLKPASPKKQDSNG